MADGFYSAVGAASRSAMGLPPKADAPPVTVTWTHAVTGIVVLAILQAALLVIPFSSMLPEALRAIVDFGVVALVTLAAPFAVLGAAALLLNKRDELPAIFLFIALVLAVSQIISLALSAFGVGSGAALIGLLGYFGARVSKSMLGVGWGIASLIGLLVAAATFAAGFLFLVLPTGQAMLGAQ